MKRRRFLQALPLTLTAAAVPALPRELGITTGSFVRHLVETAQPGKGNEGNGVSEGNGVRKRGQGATG